MTKVHIAYDDGTLTGVYASRKAAKRALEKYAENLGFLEATGWARGGDQYDRTVTSERCSWMQWIETYEVQP